jgi:DNA mismatch endonuclease (patch repair protein)
MENDSVKIAIRKSMKSNRNRDTKPEILLRQSLWNSGLKGYRKNFNKLPGKPDIFFPRKKISIFINGCFWHQCPRCRPPRPKSNNAFWNRKLDNNIKRDKRNYSILKKQGIKVIIVWECELKSDLKKVINKIKKYIYSYSA